ncbi:MAG: hypothetical protein WCO89_02340 [Syntrophus sp. (in: bacteria)]
MKEIVRQYSETKDIRFLALGHAIDMQRSAGLRFEESSKIDLVKADFSNGQVAIGKGEGMKNAKPRVLEPVAGGIRAFWAAKTFVLGNPGMFQRGTLIPMTETYDSWTNWAEKKIRAINATIGETGKFHGHRHHYAHISYAEKWVQRTVIRVECTVAAGCTEKGQWKEYASKLTGLSIADCKRIDKEIRTGVKGRDATGRTIVVKNGVTQELGHSRQDVTNSYCGSSV